MENIAVKCRGLNKSFKKYQKEAGVIGSFKSFFSRRYEETFACKNFDLDVQKGELVGLLGPNGAGKTTLMKMFSGIIVPTSGECEIMGHIPHRRDIKFRKKIALVMGQKGQLWWDIPAMDSYLLLQKYYEIDKSKFHKRLGDLATSLGVDKQLNVHVRRLSLGERMKMELIACLLHEPETIFLDEPTIGLDLVSQRIIRDFISHHQATNMTTIFITSHYMADIDALCSRVVLMFDGKKSYDGSLDEFGNILGREKFITIRFERPVDVEDPIWTGYDPQWSDQNRQLELRLAEEGLRQSAIKILSSFPVAEFKVEKLPIERVMHEILLKPELLGHQSEQTF